MIGFPENKTASLNPNLQIFLQVIPIIHKMLPEIGMGITDTKEWIVYYPGNKIDVGAKCGLPINPEEPLAECIKYKKEIKVEVPPEFFGISFTGIASPIMDGNEVVGAIAIQIQEQNEKELRRISDQIFSSLTQANDQISCIANGAEGLSSVSDTLLQHSNRALEGMKNTDEVIGFIKNIANQTNILGLNASIEAARAGEKGRGFNIVAKEIRKLSQETVVSTEKISNTLNDMQAFIKEIGELVEKVVMVGREQALSTEEISSLIDEIEDMSKELKKYASEL